MSHGCVAVSAMTHAHWCLCQRQSCSNTCSACFALAASVSPALAFSNDNLLQPCYTHPPSTAASTSLSEYPSTSRRISRVCSPSAGGAMRIDVSSSENLTGMPGHNHVTQSLTLATHAGSPRTCHTHRPHTTVLHFLNHASCDDLPTHPAKLSASMRAVQPRPCAPAAQRAPQRQS